MTTTTNDRSLFQGAKDMKSIFLVIDYDESRLVMGAYTNRYRADQARRKRPDWRKLRIVEIPLDEPLPDATDADVAANTPGVARTIVELVTEAPERLHSRYGCTVDIPAGTPLVVPVGLTDDKDGILFHCPGVGEMGCTRLVAWYDDCTATWCESCSWSGWGRELRYGLPGSLTGVL